MHDGETYFIATGRPADVGKKSRRIATRAIHGARKKGHGPLAMPIFANSVWALSSARQGADFAMATAPAEYYSRWGNPTVRDLEAVLADLEGGTRALATASGMGAIAPAILMAVEAGSHAVAGSSLYTATTEMFAHVLPRFKVRTTFVDPRQEGAWRDAVTDDTKLVYLETPANPTMILTDIREAVKAARSVGATVLADNTFATPILQRPLELGVDVALHSATKYFGGHADVMAGAAVTASEELFERLWSMHKILGPNLSPFDAFLVRRGLKTLPLRVRQQSMNAQALAEFLEDHAGVRAVYYPGLKAFPQHALARRQMSGFGAMLSFELRGGFRAGKAFVEAVEVATLAVSLGGTETLVQHPASMSHGPLTDAEKKRGGISEGLVRVSVGLEDVDDLIEDVDAALRKASR